MRAYPALFAALFASVAALAACHGSPGPAPSGGASTGESASASASAAPEAKPGMTLTDARLVLPAVSGNPGVLYFTLANHGDKPVTVAAIAVDGVARAEAHETVGGKMILLGSTSVPARGSVAFAPGGKHVMLFDLSTSLVARGATEMTLTFADGDKISSAVEIAAAGSTDAMAM